MNSVKGGLNGAGGKARGALAGVLFDKDGTLIDFQRTWGPAIHFVIHALAQGDAEKVRAQAECLHFDVAARRFRATSPIIGGATAHYGMAWAQSLGRDDFLTLRAKSTTSPPPPAWTR
jgi:phosphoglycolate phosphatase